MDTETEPRPTKRKPLVLILALVGVAVLLICAWQLLWPRAHTPLAHIDFSTSAWLDDYMEHTVTAHKKDFTQSGAFSYHKAGGKFVLLYASMAEVGETRDFYKETYGATEGGRNDETALDLSMELPEGTLHLVNYHSMVSRIFEQTLRTTEETGAAITTQLEAAFPQEQVATALEGTALTVGAPYGGYVRYVYDDLDGYYTQGAPIFSRGYQYADTPENFSEEVTLLQERFSEHSYDDAQDTYYFQTASGVLSVALMENEDGKQIVTIAMQVSG